MSSYYTTRVVDFNDTWQKKRLADFLGRLNLSFDSDTEYTLVIEKDDRIIATASFAGKIIKQVGIDEEFQGQGITSALLDPLIKEMLLRGRDHIFIYTKPIYEGIFITLGFKIVARVVPYISLLEWGSYSIKKYINYLEENRSFEVGTEAAAIVVNCNPFTLGHRYLIQKASQENQGLYIFVVKEDRSLFPYHVRLDLVRKGVADLRNVCVLEGGDYIISSATFPAYFTREKDRVKVQTILDIEIFAKFIAPALGIKKRYVGEEPYCDVTRQYNKTMKELLPSKGIELIEVERKGVEGSPVSASFVRECIRKDNWDYIKKLVPESTLDFLQSQEAQSIIERIKTTHSRH